MAIISISGQIGSGKSFYQLAFALEQANQKEKQIVCNFRLNREALKIYCEYKNYKWCSRMLEYGGISEIPAPKNIQELLIPRSIICLDEAGILLNSRNWKETPRDFLSQLCQSRKTGMDLIWVAQFPEQVDSQMRMLTQYWIEASGLTYYDKKTGIPRLYYKRYYFMDALMHHRAQSGYPNHFKKRFAYSYRYIGGILGKADYLLFDCFDSKELIDRNESNYRRIETAEYSRICDRPHTPSYFNQKDYEQRKNLHQFSDSPHFLSAKI